jgi:glucoamylase
VPYPDAGVCANANEVYVTFNERVVTEWGDVVKVVGSAPELGGWDVSKAVGMSASGYSQGRPIWSITVPIVKAAGGGAVAYKYVRVKAGGQVVWEADPNRSLSLAGAGVSRRECNGEGGGGEQPGGACAAMKVDDVWR